MRHTPLRRGFFLAESNVRSGPKADTEVGDLRLPEALVVTAHEV